MQALRLLGALPRAVEPTRVGLRGWVGWGAGGRGRVNIRRMQHAGGRASHGSAQLAIVVNLQLLLTARRGVRDVELHAHRALSSAMPCTALWRGGPRSNAGAFATVAQEMSIMSTTMRRGREQWAADSPSCRATPAAVCHSLLPLQRQRGRSRAASQEEPAQGSSMDWHRGCSPTDYDKSIDPQGLTSTRSHKLFSALLQSCRLARCPHSSLQWDCARWSQRVRARGDRSQPCAQPANGSRMTSSRRCLRSGPCLSLPPSQVR